MDIVQELQVLRAELIREVDDKIGRMIESVKEAQGASMPSEASAETEYENVLPLTIGTGIFKGKRPTGVIFEDDHREQTPSWKKVFEAIMKRCNRDSEKHQALMDLRGKVLGRNRVLLDSKKGKMRSPIQIDRNMYAETHYDAETLLRIMTTRILDAVQYDYSGIKITVKGE